MAVYCEPFSDERILAQLGDARRVLTIECGAMNAKGLIRDKTYRDGAMK